MGERTVQEINGKQPVFVTVYDKLYEMLTDGTYPVGKALPPEPKLAGLLDVSRETLRKALRLLEEDGLLQKVKGKGNFVMDLNKPMVSSLEKIGNPIHKCIQVPLDEEVEMEMHLQESGDYEHKLFKRESQTALAVDRWYRSSGKIVAYTLTLAPIETFTSLGLDLANKSAMLDFFENRVYELATRSHLKVKTTWVGRFISDRYVLNEDEELTLIHENLYTEDEFKLLIHNKHYIIPEACSIEINAT
ncbi:MAG: GntR family transcriptional regulator [Youngiibacter sp.]|jgi:DNA-binding GntR family transcriptional regulator|nr:GntR family transcriptional regulator [Youngiibacter sp.]